MKAVAALLVALAASAVSAQSSPSINRSCTFADGKQISIRYTGESAKDRTPPEGQIWTPGDKPIYLFTETPVTVGPVKLTTGAYSLFLIPGKKEWTLVVSKNVTEGASYDASQDLGRVPMPTGRLSNALKQPQLAFGHIAPQQCNLRLDYQRTGAWAEFKEQQ